MSVLPKVIETPKIAAMAKDGIQLIAISRVTVRTNLDRLVGGAGEETIMARNPDHISKHILSKGLDAATAYEILFIDSADVDVGESIGAKLQIDRADAAGKAWVRSRDRCAPSVGAGRERPCRCKRRLGTLADCAAQGSSIRVDRRIGRRL